MTITIADRRGALWQWDTGRRVKITDGADVKQIHYQNRCFGCSVDVDVEDDGTAIIPDELLQDYHTLTAYAYVTDDKGGYTKVQQDFAVYKRPKPSDYVYTPTEHAGFDRLRAEIGDLDDLTTEDRSTIVAAINEAATCGTDMDITGATVGQIAKITAVDDTGKPTAWAPVDMPSGGGGPAETFELIKHIKTTEAVNEIRINADDSGEPFELKEIQVYTQLYLQDDAAATIGIRLHSSINGSSLNYDWPFLSQSPKIKGNTAANYPAAYAGHFKPKDYTIDNKKYWVADTWSRSSIGTASSDGAVNRVDFLTTSAYETHVMDAVRCVMINSNNGTAQIDANSEIWIFGKRGTVT